jgi:hypothetical protein
MLTEMDRKIDEVLDKVGMKAYAAKIPRKFLEESNNVWQPERATQ